MRTRKNRQLTLLPFLLSFLFPLLAFAEGAGIKLGEKGRFHPGIYLNGGFDSNPFNRSSNITTNEPNLKQVPVSAYFSVRPGLKLDLPTSPLGLYLAGYLNYSHYFMVANLNHLTGKADLDVVLFKDAIVSFTLSNYFSRGIGDPYSATEVFEHVKFYFNPGSAYGFLLTWNNLSRARLTIQPGGGVLQIDIEYEFQFLIATASNIDNHRHNIHLNARWKFFPKTALFFEGTFNIINYNPGAFNIGSTAGTNANMMPFKAYIGMLGQFTPKLVLMAKIGGGYTNTDQNDPRNKQYNAGDNYGMVLGALEVGYYFTPTSMIRVGFRHDFSDSTFANFYHETLGYLAVNIQLGRFLISLLVDGGYVGFGKSSTNLSPTVGAGQIRLNSQNINSDGTVNRNDFLVRGMVGFDWNILDWLTVGLEARLIWRESDTFVVIGSTQIGLGYFKFEGGLKVNLMY